MRTIFLFVSLLSFCFNHAQKIVKKSLVDSSISLIQIDATDSYRICLSTADTDKVVVEAVIDGEYKNDLLLKVIKDGATLKIGTGYQPNFKNPNDKLSAHKVISIALNIVVPEYQQVLIFGTNSNIEAMGRYKNLKVILDDGYCRLSDISESADVNTQSGEIEVLSSRGFFTATSKYGTILKEEIPEGDNHFILTTATGHIKIKKTE